MFSRLFNRKRMFENLSAEVFEKQIAQYPDARILDVRTPGEFRSGHLPGAHNINYQDSSFRQHIEVLPKDGRYLVYCRSGMRSAGACRVMTSVGFTEVANLRGGIMAWRGAVDR